MGGKTRDAVNHSEEEMEMCQNGPSQQGGCLLQAALVQITWATFYIHLKAHNRNKMQFAAAGKNKLGHSSCFLPMMAQHLVTHNCDPMTA